MKNMLFRGLFAACFAMTAYAGVYAQDEWTLMDSGNCGGADGTDGSIQWGIFENPSQLLRRLMIKGDGHIWSGGDPTAYGWNKSSYNPYNKDTGYWTGLDEVEFSEGITNVPEGGFWYHSNLRSAILPSTILHIQNNAFFGSPLQFLNPMAITRGTAEENTLPTGLQSIGHYAFAECSFTNLILPSTLEAVGENTFSWNTSLMHITCLASIPPSGGSNLFQDCSSLTAIYVPDDCVENYKVAEGWKDYASLIKPASEQGTGIQAIVREQEDAQTIYDLSGRRVERPTEGVYIVNGKKVVVK